MDYETILERARAEAGAECVAAFARELVCEWCEIYEAMSNRTTNIVRFQCGTFEYLYDDYASLEATGRVAYDPVTVHLGYHIAFVYLTRRPDSFFLLDDAWSFVWYEHECVVDAAT